MTLRGGLFAKLFVADDLCVSPVTVALSSISNYVVGDSGGSSI